MHNTTFLSLAVAVVTATAAALPSTSSSSEQVPRLLQPRGCYTSGASWGDSKAYALELAAAACNGGLGQRTYTSDSSVATVCYNIDTNKRVNFQVSKISAGDRFLNAADCQDGLTKEINGCGQGGDSSYTNWRYISDPNDGLC
ncbi:hypothetical protein F4803DRAFT_573973 [Xylaria telfairii]|nr:hypothetical protein F4803DRAFT_573973 [Xylaria telfairii]